MSNPGPGFWSSETLEWRLPDLINPFAPSRISHAAYELSLGGEAYVTGEKARTLMDDKGEVAVPPGQFAVLITEERVTIPNDAIALISMKSENKYKGLINVSGFHVDPGFSGKLLFSVFNAGSQEIHLSRGLPLFMIWYATLDRPTSDTYNGKHNGQSRIPDKVITDMAAKQYTPSALGKEIEDVRTELTKELAHVQKDIAIWRTVCLALLGGVLTNFFIPRPAGSTTPIIISPVQSSAQSAPQPSPPTTDNHALPTRLPEPTKPSK